MACGLIGTKPLSEPMLDYCQLDPCEYFNENLINVQQFSLKELHVKMSSAKWRPFCLGLNVLMAKYILEIMSNYIAIPEQPSDATFVNMLWLQLQHGLVIASNIEHVMKLPIHSQTFTFYWSCDYLSMLGLDSFGNGYSPVNVDILTIKH